MNTEFRGHPDQHFGYITYSQHFDDGMILNLFKLIGIKNPSYLDLGAHHPVNISNTKLLYDRGARGVNVEANPILIEAFKRERPLDTNVNIGVDVSSGTATFYMYSDSSGRNTFSPNEVKSLEGVLTVRSEISLPVWTLQQIVDRYCNGTFPAFLSCDIEGLDYAVLSSAKFTNLTPCVVCVETRPHDGENMKLMMNSKGFFPYCRMGENLFFVRNEFKEMVY